MPTVCFATGTPFSPPPQFCLLLGWLLALRVPPSSVATSTPFWPSTLGTNDCLFPLASLSVSSSNSHPAHPGFDVGQGRPPIPAKLVDQIKNGEYIDFAMLLPDSRQDNELPREVLFENKNVVIPKRPPCRTVKDFVTWLDCRLAYSQVILARHPTRAPKLLKYLDYVIIWFFSCRHVSLLFISTCN